MSDVIEELEDIEETPETQILEEFLGIPKEKLKSFRECVEEQMKGGKSMAEAAKVCSSDTGEEKESEEPEPEPEGEEKESEEPEPEPEGEEKESETKELKVKEPETKELSEEKTPEKQLTDLSDEEILKQLSLIKEELKKRGKYPKDTEKEKMSEELKETKEKFEKLSEKLEYLENKGKKMTVKSGLEKLSERAKQRTYYTGKDGSIWSWDE